MARRPAPNDQGWAVAWSRTLLSTKVRLASTQTQPTLPSRFDRQTYRLIVFTTVGGSQVRVQVSNRFGRAPLVIGAAHLGLRKSQGTLHPNTDRALTFSALPSVTLRPGEERWSDPVALTVPPLSDLAISLYLPQSFTPTAFHPTGLKTSYLSAPGNFCGEVTMPSVEPDTTQMVFFVSEVQMNAGPVRTIVALGDSITDGACSDADADGSWPDLLAKRLSVDPTAGPVAVVNAGIGSNRFVSSHGAGPSGLARLPGLLRRPHVTAVIVLEGINDISYEHITAGELITSYQRAIALAHEAGVTIIGIPLLPIKNSVKDVGNNEATRCEVNRWIRHGTFDAVIDLEPVMADPNDLKSLKPELAHDFVHPNQAGYRVMADAIVMGLRLVLWGDE